MSKPVKLPSGSWRVQWLDSAGKRQGATFPSHSAAQHFLRERQVDVAKVRSGMKRERSDRTLAEESAEWLKRRPESSRVDDECMLRVHIVPYLGKYRLGEITSAVRDAFARHLEGKETARSGEKSHKPLKPKTVKNILVLTAKLLTDVTGEPVRIKYKVQASSYAWIKSAEDVGRFLEACTPEWFRIAATIAVYTGMRLGEIAGLTREDLDFDRQLVRVARSYDKPTKGRKERYAPLPAPLAAVLKPWLLAHPGPLVVTVAGRPLRPRESLSTETRAACKRVGLEPITFHALRHTFASHLAQRVSLPIVGGLLGHVSPMTTAKYSHLDPESVARQERVHLTFAAPAGRVLAFTAIATAHGVHTEAGNDEKDAASS